MKLYQVRTIWLLLKYCISTHRESTDSLMKDVTHVQKLLHERKHNIVYFALGVDADPWGSPLGQHQPTQYGGILHGSLCTPGVAL